MRHARTPIAFLATVCLAACGDRAVTAPPSSPALAPAPGSLAGSWLAWGWGARAARVEILPSPMPIVYTAPTELVERDFTAVAYDAAGQRLTGRKVQWSDATNWNPSLTLQPVTATTVRTMIPYGNAAAPARTPSGECPLAWKGIRATVDGVSAVAPVCGTFAVAVAAERRAGLVPVPGDTITMGAGQPCHVQASASGGYGGYEYTWHLDGAEVGAGATVRFETGPPGRRTLVLRVHDHGHDIVPWRELTFVLEVDGSGDAELDC